MGAIDGNAADLLRLSPISVSKYTEWVEGQMMFMMDAELRRTHRVTLDGSRKPAIALGKPGVGKTESIMKIVKKLNAIAKDKYTMNAYGKDGKLIYERDANGNPIPLTDARGNIRYVTDKHGNVRTRINEETGELEKIPMYRKKQIPLYWNTIQIRLGQIGVGEMSGTPDVSNNMEIVPYDALPKASRDGEYGILFLDEFTTAMLEQTGPATQLLDSTRGVGANYKLPPGWLVLAAGNDLTCSNFVRLDQMNMNRFAAFLIEPDAEEWIKWGREPHQEFNELGEFEDYEYRIDPMIRAYIRDNPDALCDTDEGILRTEMTEGNVSPQCPTPRSWQALSQHLARLSDNLGEVSVESIATPLIGSKYALDFALFYAYKKYCIWDANAVLMGVEGLPVPDFIPFMENADVQSSKAVEIEAYKNYVAELVEGAKQYKNDHKTLDYFKENFKKEIEGELAKNCDVYTGTSTSFQMILNDVRYITIDNVSTLLRSRYSQLEVFKGVGNPLDVVPTEDDVFNDNSGFVYQLANALVWITSWGDVETAQNAIETLKHDFEGTPVLDMLSGLSIKFNDLCPAIGLYVTAKNSANVAFK